MPLRWTPVLKCKPQIHLVRTTCPLSLLRGVKPLEFLREMLQMEDVTHDVPVRQAGHLTFGLRYGRRCTPRSSGRRRHSGGRRSVNSGVQIGGESPLSPDKAALMTVFQYMPIEQSLHFPVMPPGKYMPISNELRLTKTKNIEFPELFSPLLHRCPQQNAKPGESLSCEPQGRTTPRATRHSGRVPRTSRSCRSWPTWSSRRPRSLTRVIDLALWLCSVLLRAASHCASGLTPKPPLSPPQR